MSHHIISYQALRRVGNLRFLLYVPLNFHTPVNADGFTNHFTTHTHIALIAVALTCTFTDTMPLKIEQNLDLFQQLAIQVENGLTCFLYTIWWFVCFMTTCVCECVWAPTGVVLDRSRPVVTWKRMKTQGAEEGQVGLSQTLLLWPLTLQTALTQRSQGAPTSKREKLSESPRQGLYNSTGKT